ncbi:MAG: alkaline phosphatase D family protein [Nitrospira sp.]
MKIRRPTVGPIVGHASGGQSRVWLRGEFQKTPDGYGRCFGVVRLRIQGDSSFGDPIFVKLPPYFDMTGVCVFSGLQPDTVYEYQAGWFFAETELANLDATQGLDWTDVQLPALTFRTGSINSEQPRSYAFGSCRYLLRLFGGAFFDERGDKVFRSILDQHSSGTSQIHAVIMAGDQIYADDLNFVSPDDATDEYFTRYQAVFGQKHIRDLMSRVPTYMILDDHEIEDNWPNKATEKDWLTLYPSAIHAYQVYQCSHSPLFSLDESDRLTGTLDRFWYTFQDGCCDCFVMDTRTERRWSENPKKRRMISRRQMEALLTWLNDGSGRVKLVVTSVPFFPDMESDSDDKWCGFLDERTEVLDFIRENEIRKVVFLSGDVHCSFSVELKHSSDSSFKVISVVSSSFFWPYPHMEDSDFVFKGKLKATSKQTYRVVDPSPVHSTDNFARLDISPESIAISFFERKGEQLGEVQTRRF